ncbi:MAG: glycosyltransferase family 39 protein [Candidatus Alcyoniella australis]|nr:glycosyltransferase family 39 protein [Candidatus Alcyoniella australis]
MRRFGWLALLVSVHLAIRALILFFGDVNWWAPLTDETPTGNIASALAGGSLVMPWQAYQFKPFAGGTVLEGLMAWPFFAQWGDRLICLRAAPIIFSLLTMILWVLFLDRYFSRRAAVFSGLLFAAPPPLYGLLSVTAWGNHTESSLLTIVALWGLIAMLGYSRPKQPGALSGLALGVLCGLGLWFSYTFAVTLAMLLILWALLDRRWPLERSFLAFWPGLLIGLIPWYLNYSFWGHGAMFSIDTYTGYETTAYIEGSRMFLESQPSWIGLKALRLIGYALPRSALYPAVWKIPGAAFSIIFYLLTLGGALALLLRLKDSLHNPLRRNRARALDPRLSILVFPPLFCLVLVLSGFRVEDFRLSRPQEYVNYRYLGPALPFIFAWIGVGADSALGMLRERRLLRRISAAFIALTIGALCLVPCIDLSAVDSPRFSVLKFRGSDQQLVLERLAGIVGGAGMSTPTSLEILHQLPADQLPLAFEHFGYIGPPASELAQQMVAQARGEHGADLDRGMGRHLAKQLLDSQGAAAMAQPCVMLEQITDQVPTSVYTDPCFWEGVGMQIGAWTVGNHSALASDADTLGLPSDAPPASRALATVVRLLGVCQNAPDRRLALMRGLGRLSVDAFSVMPGEAPLVDEPFFYQGVGAQLRRNALLDLFQDDVAIDALFRVPRQQRGSAVKGWVDESKHLGIEP